MLKPNKSTLYIEKLKKIDHTQLTGDQLATVKKEAFRNLLDQVGGTAHLARMLNIALTTVYGWEQRQQVSKEGAQLIEAHHTLGEYFKASSLRPDIN